MSKEIWKRNSSDLLAGLILLCTSLFFASLSWCKSQEGVFVFSLLLIMWSLYNVARLKSFVVFKDRVEWKYYWSKAVLWSSNYTEIARVEVDYFSDTIYRSKHMNIFFKDGNKKRITVVRILMNHLLTPFINNNIPVYIEKNNRYVPYKRPSYDKP